MLTKRIARNPDSSERFLTFSNLHSISTCCALLRHGLRRLAVGGVNPHGCELPLPTVTFRLRLWSRQRRFAPFPRNQPSCARTNTTISAPRMPRRSPLHPPPGMPLKKIVRRSGFTPLSSFFSLRQCRHPSLRIFFQRPSEFS